MSKTTITKHYTKLGKPPSCHLILQLILLVTGFLVSLQTHAEEESFCATVKIEIKQELTLERQAFDAHMRINNGLEGFNVEDVKVDVKFSDENGDPIVATSDPENTEASFFIRIDSMSNIDDINGTGVVLPKSSADIHWLIIPAPGSGGETSQGKLYYVGATLTYTLDGEEKVVEVSPDYIYVRPMPLLTLDYFLPREVYADDSFTPIIEPIEPFNLGVRVKNNGRGPAYNLKIDSAQPKIIENELGLVIDFRITGSSVNDDEVAPSLLVNIGDIEPSKSGIARWVMETTLSGEFVEFTAEFTHADELGGELTSLLEATNTHTLLHDVMVDLPGRDAVKDFLAKDGDAIRVYESSGLDTIATNQTPHASLQLSSSNGGAKVYALNSPATDGFFYVKIRDPNAGTKKFTTVMRSDGKVIKSENIWISKTRRADNGWDHYINLFDVNTGGSYQLTMENLVTEEVPPVLQFISDRKVIVGSQVSFLVEASDLNGTLPSLSAEGLQTGMEFFADSNGPAGITTYIFDWTPAPAQAGVFPINFVASDAISEVSQFATITVCAQNDSDCDGMDDDWERDKFGDLTRNGKGDLDGDGHIDLLEFVNNSDPTIKDAPSIPVIKQPLFNTHVASTKPKLMVENSVHGDDLDIQYEFEIYRDQGYSQRVTQAAVSEQDQTTAWSPDNALEDNHWFFWRVRTCDPVLCSEWANSQFFVNTVNDIPGPFVISSPENGVRIANKSPTLMVSNSSDIDGDPLLYHFEVYINGIGGTLIASVDDVAPGNEGFTPWQIDPPLDQDRQYYWQAIVKDSHGATRTVTEPASFIVDTNNAPPSAPTIKTPENSSTATIYSLALTVNNSEDADGDTINYYFELDAVNTFDSPGKQISEKIAQDAEGETSWLVDALQENQRYFWRAKADDGLAQSDWVNASFFVNAENEAPTIPAIKNPGDNAWVETIRPQFSVHSSTDADGDQPEYEFEVYSDIQLSNLIKTASSSTTTWTIDQDLSDNSWFYWRVRANDNQGKLSDWSAVHALFVNDGGVDDAPQFSFVNPAQDIKIKTGELQITWQDHDPDSNATIAIYYEFGEKGSGGILIQDGIHEDEDGASDALTWDVTGLTPGDYFIYAEISDLTNNVTVYADAKVQLGSEAIGGISINVVKDIDDVGVCVAFDVSLTIQPDESVKVNLRTNNPTFVALSETVLEFSPENWNLPQQIKLTGFNGCVKDNGTEYLLIIESVESQDLNFDGLTLEAVVLNDLLKEPADKGKEQGENKSSGSKGGTLSMSFIFIVLAIIALCRTLLRRVYPKPLGFWF